MVYATLTLLFKTFSTTPPHFSMASFNFNVSAILMLSIKKYFPEITIIALFKYISDTINYYEMHVVVHNDLNFIAYNHVIENYHIYLQICSYALLL